MKKYPNLILMLTLMLLSLSSHAQQAIAQPYYGDGKIRFYNKHNPIAGSPCYTLDISADINTNWGTTSGINDVIIYQSKLFVSIDNGNGEGGVLVYNYADVYPAKTAGPVSVINPQNSTGLPVAGITIQPGTGDLFVGTFYTGASDAGIYTYTAASGYANSSATHLASYYNDNSIDKYIANLTFDPSGNLWFTEFDSAAYPKQFLIVYPGVNKSQYHVINNPTTKAYTATPASGGTGTPVYLLSQPEGIVFDANGNLWLGNNNDDYACNTAGDGTLVKIRASWITDTFMNIQSGYSTNVPVHDATVYLVPSGKLGGMLLDVDTLYINDQGQNQGTSYTSNGTVWKYNVNSAFNTTNFAASGIHTTYPGNGLMALDNSQFSVASDCYPSPSSEKNILTFTISGQIGSTTIDTTHATVALLVPSGANLASLTPTITVSTGAAISPLSGVSESFTAPKTYTVTAADHSTKTWTVTVTKQSTLSDAKNILTFAIPSQVGTSVIDTIHASVTVVMPAGTNLTSLTPSITVSAGASVSPLTGVVEDFSAPYTYTVTAADATTELWTINVSDAPSGISGIAQSGTGFSLYPNPANDRIYINASSPAAIEIYNIVGELVQRTAYDTETIEVNISSYTSGIYFARLQYADGGYATRKFVKE